MPPTLEHTTGTAQTGTDDLPDAPSTASSTRPVNFSATTTDIPASPNPWGDSPADSAAPTPKPSTLDTLDPALLDQPGFAGLERTDPPTPKSGAGAQTEVLNEFDPLTLSEEKEAREAWASAEGHPPPRQATPPVPAMKDLYITSPTSPDPPRAEDHVPTASAQSITSPSFPSFGAFARAFSIPLVKPRPLSFDGAGKSSTAADAVAVPSPSTSGPLSTEQNAGAADAGKQRDPGTGASTPDRTASGTSSPIPKASDGSFDFQKFLDQMKTKSAEPVSKYLRSFLSNFAKRTFTVTDQVKIINDFLNFIAGQMRECDVWKNASDAEFENAMEGMEKLVMNRLHDFTFTPQLALNVPPRPNTTDDLEKDRVLSQRIALFGWLEEKHLDIPEGEGSKGFLMFAQQELLKINHYKAPRDKLICILNCCKVIFGLLRHLHKEEGADTFLPVLIYVVIKANPQHLLSNVEFINRFRNPAKLQSEAGYYLSSLMGAVSFIETMDHTSLSNISQEEFERNVEDAIQALPQSEPQSPAMAFAEVRRGIPSVTSPAAGEESAQPLAITTPAPTLSDDAKRLLQKTGDTISKPLNALGRIFTEALDGAESKLSYLPGPFAPLELGRENRAQPPPPLNSASLHWQGGPTTPRSAGAPPPQTPFGPETPYSAPIQTPYKPRVKRFPSPSLAPQSPGSPAGYEDTPSRPGPYTNSPLAMGPSTPFQQNSLMPQRVQSLASNVFEGNDPSGHISRTPTPALNFSEVEAQIDASHEQAALANRETLRQIFPTVENQVIELILDANDGDLGRSIEALLEMSGAS